MTTLISGGLAVDPLRRTVEPADVTVTGRRLSPPGTGERVQRIDASGCIVMPGHVCAHHHLYAALARGMPPASSPARSFPEILERVWWRLDAALDADLIGLAATLGAVEAVRSGTTTIVDHHASPNAIEGSLDGVANGITAAGARGVVCYEVSDRHGAAGARAGIVENKRFLRDNARPLVRAMVGAHASFTIGEQTLANLVGVARDLGAPIHIHVAEDGCDERDSLTRYGCRTAVRLERAGALLEGDLIAHGVHLDAAERRLVATSGAWLAHNPRSNMNNAVGYARPQELGERVALGTDGLDGDLFAEARACYLAAQQAGGAGSDRFALARLCSGADLAGSLFSEPALGTLAPGAPADLMVLDYRPPTPLKPANVAGHLLFGAGAANVRDVMVAGRWIVRDRKHLLVDEDELAARCRAAAPLLWARMAESPVRAG